MQNKLLVALATLLLAGSAQAVTLPYSATLAFGLATLPGAQGPGSGGSQMTHPLAGLWGGATTLISPTGK